MTMDGAQFLAVVQNIANVVFFSTQMKGKASYKTRALIRVTTARRQYSERGQCGSLSLYCYKEDTALTLSVTELFHAFVNSLALRSCQTFILPNGSPVSLQKCTLSQSSTQASIQD